MRFPHGFRLCVRGYVSAALLTALAPPLDAQAWRAGAAAGFASAPGDAFGPYVALRLGRVMAPWIRVQAELAYTHELFSGIHGGCRGDTICVFEGLNLRAHTVQVPVSVVVLPFRGHRTFLRAGPTGGLRLACSGTLALTPTDPCTGQATTTYGVLAAVGGRFQLSRRDLWIEARFTRMLQPLAELTPFAGGPHRQYRAQSYAILVALDISRS